MKMTGTTASMALTIGALMLQLSEAAAGRGQLRRVLEDASDDATNGGAGEGNSNSYYSSGGWNGRGQSWSSSSQIQSYNDDGITEFTVDNSSNKLNIFGSFGGGEIFMLLGLLIIVGISAFSYMALKNDFNVIHLYQVYVRPRLFPNDKEVTIDASLEEAESSEPTGDFVKVEDAEAC